MSRLGHGFVEAVYEGDQIIREVARVFLDAIPDLYALLGCWGHWENEEDLPDAIVASPRGFPKKVSHLLRSELRQDFEEIKNASWFTVKELELAAASYYDKNKRHSCDLEAVVAMMKSFEKASEVPVETRLVVWFT